MKNCISTLMIWPCPSFTILLLVSLADFLCNYHISSVQFSHSVMSDSLWFHESQHTRPPCPITNSQRSLKLMSIESVMPFSHLILCRPLLFLHPIPPSISVFSNKSTLRIRCPKYWSFTRWRQKIRTCCTANPKPSGTHCLKTTGFRHSFQEPVVRMCRKRVAY